MALPLKRMSNQLVFGPKPLVAKRAPWSNAPRRSQNQVKSDAAKLRRSLQNGTVHDQVTPSSVEQQQLLVAANLLMLMGNETKPPRPRCGMCHECVRQDCGKCSNCLDKPRFGGFGSRKQACSKRKCVYIMSKNDKPNTGLQVLPPQTARVTKTMVTPDFSSHTSGADDLEIHHNLDCGGGRKWSLES